MRKNYIILIGLFILIMISFSRVYVYASNEKAYELKREYILEYINEYRGKTGLPLFVMDENLNKAALEHSKYMKINNVFSKEEQENKELFTGVHPWDRVAYFSGGTKDVYEDVGKGGMSYKYIIDRIMADKYKRIYWLNPIYDKIGIGFKDGVYTFDLVRKDSATYKIVKYPFKDQSNVKNLKLNNNVYAMPITVSYYSDSLVKSFEDINIRLIDTTTGKEIPISYKTFNEDEELVNTIKIQPSQKYISNHIYRVSVEAKAVLRNDQYKKIREKWNFTAYKDINLIVDRFVDRNKKNVNIKDMNNHWAKKYIEKYYKYDIIKENSRTFDPNKNIKRDQMVQILIDSIGITNFTQENYFNDDVSESDFNCKYINTAYEYGFVNGVNDTNFGPQNNITREQLVSIIVRTFEKISGKIDINESKLSSFKDLNQCSDWALENMKKAISIGLINGKTRDEIKPKLNITKAEVIVIIDRLISSL